MLVTKQLRPAHGHLFAFVVGLLTLGFLAERDARTWSYAVVFALTAVALSFMGRAIIFLLRSQWSHVFNHSIANAESDLFPCLVIGPVVLAWWLVAQQEPIMGSAKHLPYVLEVLAAVVFSTWILQNFAQWAVQEHPVRKICDGVHRFGAILFLALVFVALLAQLRSADVPTVASSLVAKTVSEARVTSSYCTDGDDDSDAALEGCADSESATTLPTATSHAVSTYTKASSGVGLSYMFMAGLDHISMFLADTTWPFHLSSLGIGLVSLLKLFGRLYLVCRKISGVPTNPDQSESMVLATEAAGTPPVAAATVVTLMPDQQSVNPPYSIENDTDLLSVAAQSDTSDGIGDQSAGKDLIEELLQTAVSGISAAPVPQLSSVAEQVMAPLMSSLAGNQQSVAVEQSQSIHEPIEGLTSEHHTTLMRLQSLLAQPGVLSTELVQHQAVLQRLLALGTKQ